MRCGKCGKQLPEGVSFCPTCGTKAESPQVSSPVEHSASKGKKLVIVVLALLIAVGVGYYGWYSHVNTWEYQFRKATEYQGQGEMDKAIAAFQKAIDCDPLNVTAYHRLSEIYERMDDTYASEQILQQCRAARGRKTATQRWFDDDGVIAVFTTQYDSDGRKSNTRFDPENSDVFAWDWFSGFTKGYWLMEKWYDVGPLLNLVSPYEQGYSQGYSYDEEGKLVQSVAYLDDETIITNFAYTSDGRIQDKALYNTSGSMCQTTHYEYEEWGHSIKTDYGAYSLSQEVRREPEKITIYNSYDTSDLGDTCYEYYFDAGGRILEAVYYSAYDTTGLEKLGVDRCDYDDDGTLIKLSRYNCSDDGEAEELDCWHEFGYDDNGDLSTVTIHKGDNTYSCEFTYEDAASYDQVHKTSNETDPPKIENEPADSEERKIFVSLKRATPFSEGIAWVLYEDPNGREQVGWLHTDGHIDQPFPIDSVTQLGKGFSGGYTYITTGNAFTRGASEVPDSFLILNTTGDITAESPKDGSSYEILCGADGIYLVKQSIRSMTENVDKFGIIDATGHWILPCAECTENGENPFSPKGKISYEGVSPDFVYCGEGVFRAYYNSGPYEQYIVLYNAKTGARHQIDQKIEIIGMYYDSKVPVKIDGELFIMSADFELTPISVGECDKFIHNEGILLAADEHSRGDGKDTLENAVFYKTDGSVLVDLSQYHLIYEDAYDLYRFNNGLAAIVISGADGKPYLCVIDSNGEFMFEPKDISMPGNYDLISTFSSGVIICVRWDSGLSGCIVDVSGNETQSAYIDYEQIGDYVFNDGFVCMDDYYIGVDGKVLNVFVR